MVRLAETAKTVGFDACVKLRLYLGIKDIDKFDIVIASVIGNRGLGDSSFRRRACQV